jgi:hypothetical protein
VVSALTGFCAFPAARIAVIQGHEKDTVSASSHLYHLLTLSSIADVFNPLKSSDYYIYQLL